MVAALRDCLTWVDRPPAPIDVRRAVEASARFFASQGPQPWLHSPFRRAHERSGDVEARRVVAAQLLPVLLA